MKISKITIQNFRCFYGKHVVEFDTDGKITILYGLAGSGKTSLLQFISWVLYDKNDFASKYQGGKEIQNYPLYNSKLDSETVKGSTFDVKGIIEFSHDGVDYQVIRSETYRKGFTDSTREDYDFVLLYSDNGNWVEYSDDIPSKINEIVPKALSKYFFFHGEKMDLLNNEDADLKNAIYQLFNLNRYEEAINHLGGKGVSQSVIHKYYVEKNKQIKTDSKDNPSEIYNKIASYNSTADVWEKEFKLAESREKHYSDLAKQVIDQIGQKKSSGAFEQTLRANQKLIKEYEEAIQKEMYSIGKCLYRSVPYLMLSSLTSNSVRILAEEAKSQASKNAVVFKHIRKDLLKEIIEKNICVCGKCLDDESKKYIQNVIDSMPPDSYIYQLKQFASNASDYINNSQKELDKFNDYLIKITGLRNEILSLNGKNAELIEQLRRAEATVDLANKYEEYDKKAKEYSGKKANAKANEEKFRKAAKQYTDKYNQIMKDLEIKSLFDEKIEILEATKKILDSNFKKRISETVETLEDSIVEVYKNISTRTEDFDKIKFLNPDFSLRRVSRTGGQEAIDVYSYIIGMIKALHQLESDTNEKEFPIIIDAPFSHTDVIQANHVFNTLPTIAPQVIVLSLELDKFRNSISDELVGKTYVITSNKEQKSATISRCTISELFEIEAENAKKAVAKGDEE